jgi:hypothetical protein
MANYYIATTGSDSNNGTSTGTPWQTIAHVNAQTFSPGDTIHFNGGDTFIGSLVVGQSGSSGNQITVTSYGIGQAIIGNTSQTVPAVQASNQSYVTVSNLSLVTQAPNVSDSGGSDSSVRFTTNTSGSIRYPGINVSGNTVAGGKYGIYVVVPDGSSDGFDNLTITNNSVSNSSNFGILILSPINAFNRQTNNANAYIGYNTVTNIPGTNASQGTGIVMGYTTVGVIEYNYVANCGFNTGSIGAGPAGIFPISSNGVVMRHNYVTGIATSASGSDGDGIDIDINCDNCIGELNVVTNCGGPGALMLSGGSGNVYRWNLLINNCLTSTQDVISAGSTGGSCYVFNNTIIQPPNISGALPVGTTITFANNLVQGSSTDFNGSNGNVQVTGTNGGNPLILSTSYLVPMPGSASAISTLNSFRPLSGSPLLTGGINIATTYSISPGTTDLSGTTLASTYPVGCWLEPGARNLPVSYDAIVVGDGASFYTPLQDSGVVADELLVPLSSAAVGAGITVGQSGSGGSRSFNFSGSAFLSYPKYDIGGATSASFECWIKNGAGWIASKWNPSFQWTFIASGSEIEMALSGGGGGGFLIGTTSGANIAAGSWHHIAAVWGGAASLVIYVNGVSQTISFSNTDSLSSLPSLPQYANIVGGDSGSEFYSGNLERVAVYKNVALTSTQVLAHYIAGSSSPATGYTITSPPNGVPGVYSDHIIITATGGNGLFGPGQQIDVTSIGATIVDSVGDGPAVNNLAMFPTNGTSSFYMQIKRSTPGTSTLTFVGTGFSGGDPSPITFTAVAANSGSALITPGLNLGSNSYGIQPGFSG